MTKDIWINLPVRDIRKSKEFFMKLGFQDNPGPGNSEVTSSFLIGSKKIIVMLATESTFESWTQSETSDAKKVTEVMFSIDAESRNEVDEIAKKAVDAGGNLFGKPAEIQGWMYGCGFADLDGHRWNVLYMDMEAAAKFTQK